MNKKRLIQPNQSHWKICHYLYTSLAYLCVALPAVGADVGLDVLGLLVLGDVLEQGLLVSEALVAGVALVGLVSLVTPGVGLQVGQLGEGLGAACNRDKNVSSDIYRVRAPFSEYCSGFYITRGSFSSVPNNSFEGCKVAWPVQYQRDPFLHPPPLTSCHHFFQFISPFKEY
jgi:hypothetical protein